MGKMGTWLRDMQFHALCVAPSMAMTICHVVGVKCKVPLKAKISSKERYINQITLTFTSAYFQNQFTFISNFM